MTVYVGSDKIKDTGAYGVYLGSQNTNCLTKTPKNINLTLSNGTLTLKAGSKVYVPNGKNADGSLKFDEVVIGSDVVATNYTGYTFTALACYVPELNKVLLDGIYTGSGNGFEYNVQENYLRLAGSYTDTTWTGKKTALPLGLIEMTSSVGATSIIQTFDWCGYIGSTAFVLPGVKGFIPNGFNADGTYKNIEFENTTVAVNSYTIDGNYYLRAAQNETGFFTKTTYHDKSINRIVYDGVSQTRMLAGEVTISSGVITSLTPYTAQPEMTYIPFNAIYNGSDKVYQYNSYQPSTVLVSQAGDNTSRTIKLRKGVYEIAVTGGGGFGKYGWYNAIFHGQGGSGSSIYGEIYVPEDTTITYYAGTDNQSSSSSAYGYSSYIAVSGTQILTAGGGQSGWDLGNNGAGGTTTNNISASKIQNISLTFKNGVAGGSGGTSVDPDGISGEGGKATGTSSDRGNIGRVYIKYLRYNK